tara:strand:+ start:9716 stop:10069 length:354 start_codon:yes stop_codon:yes gene_type:complete
MSEMDMSNSLIASGFQSPILTPARQAERQARLPVPNQQPIADKSSAKNSQTRNDSTRVNQVEFIKKGEALQTERFQRINSLENAPLKGQQALNSYQQTIDAAKQYEEGELVGIDLYV